MSDLLKTIAAYVPPGIIRTVLAEASPRPPTEATADRFRAAVLFADISGFTPLTEALGQKGAEGPEELARLLNRYFAWMIAFIEAQGGEVVKFGGDALIAIFSAEEETLSLATRRAFQAAETMQSAMDEFRIMESSAGLVTLAMKIGIGVGEVLAARVGGLFNRWEYIITGDPLRQAAQAQHQAWQNEIVLSQEAEQIIAPHAVAPRPLPQPDWSQVRNPAAAEEVLRCYVPRTLLTWLDEELQDWVATLRPMSVLFAGVKGLDYEQADAVEKLHTFVRGVRQIINHYQGSLPRLAVDDKGTVLLILFGAPPYAHQDDPERALRCALDLQALAEEQNLQLSVGVTTGRVFVGPVGGDTRREYTVMGDTVNLASRLMTMAGPGQVLCNYETYRTTRGQMSFVPLSFVRVKGKAGPIRLYRSTGEHRPTGQVDRLSQTEPARAPVGRQGEIATLAATLDEVQAGHGRVVIIEGEAGIGKSRLVEVFIRLMQERGLTGLVGLGRSIEQNTPYRAWRDIFHSFFGLDNLDPVSDTAESPDWQAERQRLVQAQGGDLAPDLVDYLPLLNDILNLKLPETASTVTPETTLRHKHLVSLLLALLQARANEKPLVLILEDAQWLDLPSWDLTVQVAQALTTKHLPLLLMVVMRPLEGSSMRIEPLTLARMANTRQLRLDSLSPDETLDLAAARLGLTGNDLPEAVAELVRRRAGGNPFFAEELILTLHDDGFITLKTARDKTRCLVSGDLDQANQIVPSIIQGIILSRIDQLPPEEQLALKVAAVIGHTFSHTTLRDSLGKHLELSERLLRVYLDDLVHLDFIRRDPSEPDLTYQFKYAIIREVTYQSLLFHRRRQLHRTVAEWYEETYGNARDHGRQLDEPAPAPEAEISPNGSHPLPLTGLSVPLAPYYPLLVHHWHQARDEDRERHYAALVGLQAAGRFANSEALGYLSRALELTPRTDLAGRYELLLARERVYDRLGEREAQAKDLEALAALAEEKGDDRWSVAVALHQAGYAEATGNYSAAVEAAQQAVARAGQIRDPADESRGYIVWARALRHQGKYEAAQAMLEKALALAQANQDQHAEAESIYNLAAVCSLQGSYSMAERRCYQALAICRANGFHLAEADNLNLLGFIQYRSGNYPAARSYFEQAIPIYHRIGDRRRELKPFHNIGLIYLGQDDYEAARDYFEQTLDTARETKDRKIEADTLSNLGLLYCNLGDYRIARSYQSQALDIREEIGDRVGKADSLSKFGCLYDNQGDNDFTRRYCEMALAIQREYGDREGEAISLVYLGHALAGLGQPQAAANAFDKVLHLCGEVGQPGLAIDALAGLAQVALMQNDPQEALAHTEEFLAWIEANGTTGIDSSSRVYLTAYHVLCATALGNPAAIERAQAVLDTAHTNLQERAARLSDQALRHKFLKNIKVHRDIIAIREGRENRHPKSMEREEVIRTIESARDQGEMPNLHKAGLAGSDLNRANLRRVYLSGANLSQADLHRADLSWAYLREANLSQANLSRANLRGANLFRANLRGADLTGADLRRVNLHGADLRQANLRGVNLRGANLFRANLGRADLTEASLIGTNTRGANLRGANLTEANITNEQLSIVRSLEQAIMPDGTQHD